MLNYGMSRADDISKSNELLKKYGIKEAKKDLDKTRADTKALKIMNSIGHPTNYAEAVAFGLATSEYLGKKKNIKFLKSLPQGADDSEYEKLPQKTKERLVDIAVNLKKDFEDKAKKNVEESEVLTDKKDILLKGLMGKLMNEVGELESELSKVDYKTGWECALDCRRLYAEGDLPDDVKSVSDAYRWGVKHCTIKGKDIDRFSTLASAYDNTKHNRTKSGKIIDKFEEKYYDKIN